MDEPRAENALARIRALELEMAQRLDGARTNADADVVRAGEAARRAVADARRRGAEEAEERRRDRLDAATAEAERIRRAGHDDAAELLAQLRPRLGDLVDEMIEVVLTTTVGDGR
jgi:vacuolar-type H+-ATPase subunit H